MTVWKRIIRDSTGRICGLVETADPLPSDGGQREPSHAEEKRALEDQLERHSDDLWRMLVKPQLEAEPMLRGLSKTVTIRAQDLTGKFFEHTGNDLLARAFQHETDHLHGKLYISHISALKRDLIKRRIRKLVKAREW